MATGLDHEQLLTDISQLIEKGRQKVAREFNSTLVLLNWLIGSRINQAILGDVRAEYGEQIVNRLADQLTLKYGKGYSRPNLFRMVRFAKLFPKKEIVSTLSRQLSWSHLMLLSTVENELKRDFYIQMCHVEQWSVRTLKNKIDSMLFERTALSKKPDEVIRKQLQHAHKTGELSPDLVFRDPCFLNFTGLKDAYSEADLETAILNQLTEFIQELGSDFCFVARQKRMSTKNKDRYLDLLFFHRRLRRLIAIDLKLSAFEPAHKGQMEWYLRWLDKHERRFDEEKPLGIILCASKDQEDVEYLELDASGIHVAQYLTELPPKALLEEKLKTAITIAKENYLNRELSAAKS
jgi:predicted nuclease of restriction endonuclease-like (RecB) superfamily